MVTIATYFLYFLIYSSLGWVIEVTKGLLENHKFVNRGFLIGPVCPIYGCGVLIILGVVGGAAADPLVVFLKAVLICSVLEYVTSFLMEKLFGARWWDYRRYKFNIDGRICLENLIPFGLASCVVVYWLQPLVSGLTERLPAVVVIILAIMLGVALIVDMIISLKVLSKIKKKITREVRDNTEDIRKQVLKWLGENSRMYRRVQKAYPDFKINLQTTKQKIQREHQKRFKKAKKRR